MTSKQLTAILEKSLPPFAVGKKTITKGDKAGHSFHGNQYQQVSAEGRESAKKLEGAISNLISELQGKSKNYTPPSGALKANVCKTISEKLGTQFDRKLGIIPIDSPIKDIYGTATKPLAECFTRDDLWSKGKDFDPTDPYGEPKEKWTYLGNTNDPKIKEYLGEHGASYINDRFTRGDTEGFGEARLAEKGANDQRIREEKASEIIGLWAQTSNDNAYKSLAVQEVAQEVFGLKNTADWTVPKETQDEIDQYRSKNDDYLKAFVQAQYDTTQEFLSKNNITSVHVERGFTFSGNNENPENPMLSPVPEWAKNLVSNRDAIGTNVEVPLRPLSSFTTDSDTSAMFATYPNTTYADSRASRESVVIQGTIPASQIFSLPSTGFGCYNEHEVVVVGGSGTWMVKATNVPNPKSNS
jgi:hypothetical protein